MASSLTFWATLKPRHLGGQGYAMAPFKTPLHSAFVAFYLDFGSHYANAAYFLTSLPCQRFFSPKLISL